MYNAAEDINRKKAAEFICFYMKKYAGFKL